MSYMYVQGQNLCILVTCIARLAIFRSLHGMKTMWHYCVWMIRQWMSDILDHCITGWGLSDGERPICSKCCWGQKEDELHNSCLYHKPTHTRLYSLSVPTCISLPIQVKLHVGVFLPLCVCVWVMYCMCAYMFLHFLWYSVCACIFYSLSPRLWCALPELKG